jgi:WD40 repeat protein
MLRRLSFLLIAFALTACEIPRVGGAQATPTPIALPSQTATAVLTGTAMPSPTSTPTETPTPLPTLGSKPYLMIPQDSDDDPKLMIYDADGVGRKLVELPSGSYMSSYRMKYIVSPDGQWLAFYTGHFVIYQTASTHIPEELPITLNLLNLKDSTIRKIVDVVTTGYAIKLDKVAEKLKILLADDYKEIGVDWVGSRELYAFQYGIHAAAWSPDGLMLAFAAQLDGISSDVYVYHLDTGEIQQVEESLRSVSSIKWSPDGKYILFRNARPGNVYDGETFHAVAVGKSVTDEPQTLFSNTWLSVGDWLPPNFVLTSDGSDTAGNFNLYKLSIKTGQITDLWLGAVSDYAVDPENQLIVINTGEWAAPEKQGVYFLSYSGKSVKVLNGIYYLSLFFRGGAKHRFIAAGIGGKKGHEIKGVFGLSFDEKEPTSLGSFSENQISISPDHAWMLLFDETNLYLYDKNDELVKTFPIADINKIIWRPDSQAIFYSTGKQLYSLSIPTGALKLLDQCDLKYCSFDLENAVWLP